MLAPATTPCDHTDPLTISLLDEAAAYQRMQRTLTRIWPDVMPHAITLTPLGGRHMLYVSLIRHPADGSPLAKVWDLTILNDGTGTEERGNYDLALRFTDTNLVRRDRLEGFLRNRGPAQLVIEALKQLNI
jgi:hypothetical protein